ncbi:uncharacterized protein LOC110466832 [Mizuhopecten yessoensis]|uniref:CCAAT/enhancer-binding protein beta n=1 Tax=Mizuhopecten yessoensis TaxID=6573 RepID=A0A210PNE6_MIZYE|nr:uncharacterized protein LOC110466832 [Mizuhopecten yessoensis]OWF38008.1 CCAAT/enhancer-binding protein beta [Mizuhopecten yessoensis]
MSNYQSVNVSNRNLNDSRVLYGPRSVFQSNLFAQTGKALDIPILSFNDNNFPGSPCPNGTLTTPGPESPHLYDIGIEELKSAFLVVNGEEERSLLPDLDPTLENSVDIDKLLNSQLIGEPNLEDYISLDLEGGHASNDFDTGNEVVNENITRPTVKQFSSIVQPETEYMQQGQILEDILGTERAGWQQIVTIKPEDLGLPPCQSSVLLEPVTRLLTSTTTCASAPPTPPSTPAPLSPTPSTASSSKEPISPRGPLPRGRPGRKPSGAGPVRQSRKRQLDKESEEYRDKRSRNNVAVRKSRDKAKIKQVETESRVEDLVSENESLQKKVELLSKELNVLKSLFVNVGAALPENFLKLIGKS